MTSVPQQVFNVAAAYAAFTAQAYAGSGSLFGSDTAPDPPPQILECPWFYLEMLADVQAFTGDPNYVETGWRWWGYDLPEAGYARLRKALTTLMQAPGYLSTVNEDSGAIYSDPETGEYIFAQRPVGLGSPTGDQQRGLLVLTASWQARKAIRGRWP